MALGRNHRIFNIGNSSGSYGISRVYHDSTLSGDGTLSSLLGVVDAGDTEVNEFVYNNSGDIIDVNNVVQSNSGEWGNGGESYSALTSNSANWNDISAYQENSGSYQPLGNYIPYTATEQNTFKTNSAFKVSYSNVGGTHTNYIDSYTLQLRYIASNVNISDAAVLNTQSLEFKTTSDSAYVDREKIHKWDNVSDYTQNNSANWNEVSSKLDASAFDPNEFYPMTGNPSGFLTAHQDISNKLDVSAFTAWSASQEENNYELSAGDGISLYDDDVNKITRIDVTAQGGNQEVESYVQTNSATINDVNTTYQNNSASYLTSISIPESANWNDATTAYQTNSASYLTAHQDLSDYVPVSSYNELKTSYDALSSLFATYSGQWLLPNTGV